MASFSVRVVDDKHKPIQRAHIVLSFTGTPRGMIVEGYTDSDGYADFVGYEEGEAEVFVSGSSYGTHYYNDGEAITITA